MPVTTNKVLIHFNTHAITIYSLKDNTLKTVGEECVTFGEILDIKILLERTKKFLDTLRKLVVVTNNECVKLYATGIF